MANATKAALQKMLAAKVNSGHRPPNLTVTEDTHENCSTCVHWDGQGKCRMYDYQTSADQTCDSWEPKPT